MRVTFLFLGHFSEILKRYSEYTSRIKRKITKIETHVHVIEMD